jgi:hypothetical protein
VGALGDGTKINPGLGYGNAIDHGFGASQEPTF